ncbi:MAG: MarR family transcriptional regulator [Peptococcaceae bacterium]|nr:MarR family transcriptional regulator [Peptococcaceae bacterium]
MEGRDWITRCSDELGKIRAELLPLYAAYMFEKDQKDGLTHVQAVLLKYLLENESSTVSAIADYLGVTMAAVSSLVDRMVRGGLITRERSESDRRVVYVCLTPRGRKAVENYLKRLRERMEHLILKMGKENAELIIKAQKILRDTLELAIKEKNEKRSHDGSKE